MKSNYYLGMFGMAMLSACTSRIEQKEKPNIIIILADDMGYSDLGCFGSEINTPNIDRLAGDGLVMTKFYNSSRSCPSRASLLTGLYSHQAGVGQLDLDLHQPGYKGSLNNNCVTIAEALKNAGYESYMSGKWHVGFNPESQPTVRGFDKSYYIAGGGGNYFDDSVNVLMLNGKRCISGKKNFYLTDAITGHAVDFINENKETKKPFFLYLAYTAPHFPLHAPQEEIAKYRGKYLVGWDSIRERRFNNMKKLGLFADTCKLSPRYEKIRAWKDLTNEEKDKWDLRMSVYAGMVDRLDQGVGKVLEAVKAAGIEKNTVIIFLSDNGACHEQINRYPWVKKMSGTTGTANSNDSYEYNWANVSNTPFRMFKHWVHEGGISTPFIIKYPGITTPGSRNSFPGHIIDLMPTIMEIAGAQYPDTFKGNKITPEAGISLVPAFTHTDFKVERPLFWEHEGNKAVRKGKWKLVALYKHDWELYDLEKDPVELNNVIKDHSGIAKELSALYDDWAARSNVVEWTGPKAVLDSMWRSWFGYNFDID